MIGATQESSVNIWLVSGGAKTARTMSRQKTFSKNEVRTMRIISQNGEINLPYDLTAIIVSENHIQAVFSGDTRKIPYLMASYSSKKSCVDVMSMLNDASLGIHAKSLVGDVTKIGMNEVIFRFPEDDEV